MNKPTGRFTFLQIDTDRLDFELSRQPVLYDQWAQTLADAKLHLETAKNKLELKRCEIDMDVRSNPDAYGLSKVTDASVGVAVTQEAEYQAAYQTVLEARHAVDIFQGVVTALEHKKRALTDIVQLNNQNYFGSIAVSPRSNSDADKRSVRSRSLRRNRGEEDGEEE